MATLALAAAGAAAGGALLPTGVSVLGATISGAALGSQIGALAGSYIDQSLFAASGENRIYEGPRLHNLHVTGSTEGATIPRLYGRARVGGQIIWATDFEEVAVTTTQSSGGGGGGKGGGTSNGSGGTTQRVDYIYYANFAVALCEGEISGIGRVWADGNEINLSQLTYRVYNGTEDQLPDALIISRLGEDNAPAFRGTAYVMFERLPLADYGNRIPQLSFEVYRSVEPFNEQVRGVVLIPGSGEFVYAPDPVVQDFGGGTTAAENVHTRQGTSDWSVAIDQLESTLPNARQVSLVVSWFGTDLRASHCEIRPGTDNPNKITVPVTWEAGGVDRSGAHVISLQENRSAYGGTPADKSVIDSIKDLKARGINVTLTPFILMDVPDGNALPNPYGGTSQAAYPWRGRITCDPAPGQQNTPDKTSAAATQIQTFVGTTQESDFAIVDETVVYSGPAEWSYRRMVLHQAHLAKAAGGVDAFIIGTELRGLTWVRDSASSYPFVTALMQLADDVKSVLGSQTKVTYAADWSEYFGHQPSDGSQDVYFHLDPLWASSSIDAIGIDCYWPLSDWRDGRGHVDFQAGTRSIYDLNYLRANVQGAEGYDWYYANSNDREAQVRTPITDGSGKPWVFRFKDIKNWWLNQHFNRPGGIESAAPTAWTPQSKPIWLTETGCPAVDKGANQPNVFVDPKSSETSLPYYSTGTRDDLIQRRYLRAIIEAFDPDAASYAGDANPISSVYSDRMVDLERIYAYTWDARPYPAFPFNLEAWGDGENWRLGHWLTGRFASAPLAELVIQLLDDYGFDDHSAGGLNGSVPGFVVDRIMSPRDALQPLSLAYFFDVLESSGNIVFRQRGNEPAVVDLSDADLVETSADEPLATLTRGQETELPATAKVTYLSSINDYQQAVVESRRLSGASGRVAQAELPIVLETDQAGQIADSWLFEAWSARERAAFVLPPSQLAIEPGDVMRLEHAGSDKLLRITEVSDHGAREIEARSIDPNVYDAAPAPNRDAPPQAPVLVGQPVAYFLDLPLLSADAQASSGYIATTQNPWPGSVAIYGSPETSGFTLRAVATNPATIGATLDPLPAGPTSRIDYGTRIQVELSSNALQSVTRLQLLRGENAAAVLGENGEWEVLQFETATLVAPDIYEISGMLRGQAGTETAMAAGGQAIPAGAPFVLLDGAPAEIPLTVDELKLPYQWRLGPANRDLGDPSYVEQAHAFDGVGLRPYSPAHVVGHRIGNDITLSWIRRTRVGGDSWEAAEVPLGEDTELYEVDILDGTNVKRTLTATAPTVVYSATDQIADFGSVQQTYDVRIYQVSSVWARGTVAAATI